MRIRGVRRTCAGVAAALLLAGCGSSGHGDSHASDHSDMSSMPGMGGSDDMGGMSMAHGDGLSAAQDGYTLVMRSAPMAGMAMPVSFVISKDGSPVTDFETEQTKQLHLYLVRDDLSGFQHLHPVMATDGTWSVTPAALQPGSYRVYAQMTPVGAAEPIVLSVPTKVGTPAQPEKLPAPSLTTNVDGYTVRLDSAPPQNGQLRISFSTRTGPAVLERYLDTYAHVTAFHAGDLAFSHLHPMSGGTNGRDGADLTFMTELPETGTYRMFVQFRAGGSLHTAAFTVAV